MPLKDGWILTEIAGEYVVVPIGQSAETFHGVVRLNETGKVIWEALAAGTNETQIAENLVQLYDEVDFDRAQQAVHRVICQLKKEGVLTE